MSYDLRLRLRQEGLPPELAATRDVDARRPLDAEDERRTRHLATVLAAAFPQFMRTDTDDVPAEDAQGPVRPVQLTSPEGGTGLRITLAAREAGLTLPSPAPAYDSRAALAEMWRGAQILESEGGFFTYDPQLGKVVDLSKDFEAALESFTRDTASRTPAAGALPPSKRPLPLFPPELDRLPYLLRWLALSAAALGLMYVILLVTRATAAEVLTLVPAVAWLVAKMLVIDTARLRAIGWSPALTFLSFFPPAALFLQLLLFFLSSRMR